MNSSAISTKDAKCYFKIEKVKKVGDEKTRNSSLSTCVDNLSQKAVLENQRIRLSRRNEELPRIRNNSFHSEFILFRSTLQLKRILRKTRIDSLLKKCKSKVFRTIQEAINLLTNLTNSKDNRLPQSFITNINIEYNKRHLLMRLEDIYKECKIFESTEDLILQNPSMTDEDKTLLRTLLSMTHKEAFKSYINSNRYQTDYNYIRQREGEKYAILFDYVAKIYALYFLNGRGNQKRNLKKFKVCRDAPLLNIGSSRNSSFSNKTGLNNNPSIPKFRFRSLKVKKKIVFRTYHAA